MTDDARTALLQRQESDWPKHVAGGKQGNPYATLCNHCYGRHKPPLDEICPHQPPPR